VKNTESLSWGGQVDSVHPTPQGCAYVGRYIYVLTCGYADAVKHVFSGRGGQCPLCPPIQGPMLVSAATTAHGALTGLVGAEPFAVGDYLLAELVELPETQQGSWLLRVACCAVAAHAGTLAGLRDHGVLTDDDLASILAGNALRREANR